MRPAIQLVAAGAAPRPPAPRCCSGSSSSSSSASRGSRCRGAALVAAAAGKGTAGKGFGAPKAGSTASKTPTKCPCGSGKTYENCCGRFHAGEPAPDPESLLRARFSAYKLAIADYLVSTTHIKNPEHTGDAKSYARAVMKTARYNTFISLTVEEQQPGSSDDEAFITFVVQTRPNAPGMQGRPAENVREKSWFVREEGRWLYRDLVE